MSKRKTEGEGDASALAAELHALNGKLKRRLREQASAGDLTPSQPRCCGISTGTDRDGHRAGADGRRAPAIDGRHRGRPRSAGFGEGSAGYQGRTANDPVADAGLPRHDPDRPRRAAGLAVRAIQTKLSAEEQAQLALALRLLGRLVEENERENKSMPISMLDAKAALVVIDLQQGIVRMPVAHPIEGVIRNAVALTEAFRARKLPVVLVNVDGAPPGRAERSARTTACRPAGPN